MNREMTFTECQKKKLLEGKWRMKFDDKMMRDLLAIKDAGRRFLDQYEDLVVREFKENPCTAEEDFQKTVLFEAVMYMTSLCDVVDYMGGNIELEGILGWDQEGNICLDGKRLPMMTELEVFAHDKHSGKNAWIRAFVGGYGTRYLVGLGRNVNPEGLRARIRSQMPAA